MLSKCGVCYDLRCSPYIKKLGNISFHFSSKFYLSKFNRLLNDYLCKYAELTMKKLGVRCDSTYFCAMLAYVTTEKRGFYIVIGGEPVSCKAELELYGMIKKAKN